MVSTLNTHLLIYTVGGPAEVLYSWRCISVPTLLYHVTHTLSMIAQTEWLLVCSAVMILGTMSTLPFHEDFHILSRKLTQIFITVNSYSPFGHNFSLYKGSSTVKKTTIIT